MSNFGLFYYVHSPNMVMSHDPSCQFKKDFNFGLILHLVLGKFTEFLVEKFSTSEVISQKPQGERGKHLLGAFRVKD